MDFFIKSVKKLIKPCDCECNAIRFKQNFKNWTSGNNYINKFIQNTQLSDHNYREVKNALEWIPYDRLHYVKYIADDEFGKVYRANWIDGCMDKWDYINQNWERKDQNMVVILKTLNNPASITSKYIDKIAVPCKVYGISQDPETRNYMVVLDFNKCGNVMLNVIQYIFNKILKIGPVAIMILINLFKILSYQFTKIVNHHTH
ncbi:hypothetical protein C1646_484902 [Rhizophagus diaphanus]|nr:hypothetical protein C1646_484902 [Rhizophagus diaphanus] [Rhizophagus sp. MUCL 43196]